MVFSKLCKHLASRQNFYLFFCYRWAQCNLLKENHCVKSVTAWSVFSLIQTEYGEIRSISFPAFGLNTERYGVSLRIQSEYGKIRTRKNSVFGYFSRSEIFGDLNDEKLKIKNCMKQKNIGNNCSTWIL